MGLISANLSEVLRSDPLYPGHLKFLKSSSLGISMTGKTIVISDLHIGAGRLDDCDSELEECLISFLNQQASENIAVELVINGDFLDFAQAEPWEGADFEVEHQGVPLCFTQDQSVLKLGKIVSAHSGIFKALGDFLTANPDNTVVILPGNHDVDFFWPNVQKVFREAVNAERADSDGVKDRVHFRLEQYYRPPSAPNVWIEHGHQYDPNNWFFIDTDEIDPEIGTKMKKPIWSEKSPPIFKDQSGTERLYECIGTRFMIRFMNGLDNTYPFVDNVKPFSRFLRIFGVSVFNPKFRLFKPAAAVWQMLSYLSKEGVTHPGSLLALERPDESFGPSALLRTLVDTAEESELVWLTNELVARGFPLKVPLKMFVNNPANAETLMTFLSKHPDLLQRFDKAKKPVLGSTPGTLSLGKGFFVDETQKLAEAALRILNRDGVEYAIMGHTHEPVTGKHYINTGCWTRYYRFGGDQNMRSWDVLKEDSYQLFPYELRYAEIKVGEAPEAKIFLEKKS